MLLEPGEYTLRLAAADDSGRGGSVHHTIRAALTRTGARQEVSDLLVAPEPEMPEPARLMPAPLVDTEMDERLPLLFGCCHPVLSEPAQLALTLRAVCGLTTEQIARATMSTPTAVGQRIVRAEALRLANLVDQARARQLLPGASGALDS